MRLLFLVGVVAVVICCALGHVDNNTSASSDVANVSKPREKLSEGIKLRNRAFKMVTRRAAKFSMSFFKKMCESQPTSTILSPLSFFLPLSMLSYGAEMPAKTRYLWAIGVKRNETRIIKRGYSRLLDTLARNNMDVRMTLIYGEGAVPALAFSNFAMKIFKASIGRITDHATPDPTELAGSSTDFSYETQEKGKMRLMNTVQFKGLWDARFDRSRTTVRPFYMDSAILTYVPTMYKFAKLPYGRIESLDVTFVELPYKTVRGDDPISMFVVLPPNREYNLNRIIEYFRDNRMKDLLNAPVRNVQLYLPKFRVESIEDVGVKLDHLFTPALNPLRVEDQTGFTDPLKLMSFDQSVVRYIVEVDEAGSDGELFYKDGEENSNPALYNGDEGNEPGDSVVFDAKHAFVAVVASKGKVFLDLITLKYYGPSNLPSVGRGDDVVYTNR